MRVVRALTLFVAVSAAIASTSDFASAAPGRAGAARPRAVTSGARVGGGRRYVTRGRRGGYGGAGAAVAGAAALGLIGAAAAGIAANNAYDNGGYYGGPGYGYGYGGPGYGYGRSGYYGY